MNTISSNNPDKCIAYSTMGKLIDTAYGSFINSLVKTAEKNMPVEILNNKDESIVKAQLVDFSINYMPGSEAGADDLTINYIVVGEEAQQTLTFSNLEKASVKDFMKNGPKTFYRFFIDDDNDQSYRFTFNRRINKK